MNPGLSNVVEADGMIYTLIPIEIRKNGNIEEIYMKDVAKGEKENDEPLLVTYTDYEPDSLFVNMEGFNASKTKIEASDVGSELVRYIGIAFFLGDESVMEGKTITITYPGADPVNIKIIGSNS